MNHISTLAPLHEAFNEVSEWNKGLVQRSRVGDTLQWHLRVGERERVSSPPISASVTEVLLMMLFELQK